MGSELIILPIQSCFLGGYSAWVGLAWGGGAGSYGSRWREGVRERGGGEGSSSSSRRSNSSRNGKQTQRQRKATEARCCCSKPRPQGFHWPIVIPSNDVAFLAGDDYHGSPPPCASPSASIARLSFHQRIPEQSQRTKKNSIPLYLHISYESQGFYTFS